MNTYELIFTVLSVVLVAGSAANLVSWLALIKRKDASPVFELWSIVFFPIMAVLFVLYGVFLANESFRLYWILIAAVMALTTPASASAVVTENGLCNILFGYRRYTPPERVQYQYNGKYLALYAPRYKRVYRLNTNNIKTVKILADFYPKHGYSNPLLPQDGGESNDKGE